MRKVVGITGALAVLGCQGKTQHGDHDVGAPIAANAAGNGSSSAGGSLSGSGDSGASGGSSLGGNPSTGDGPSTSGGSSVAGGPGASGGSSVAGNPSGGSDGESLLAVAQALDGSMLLGPCLVDLGTKFCKTVATACPGPNASDPTLSGVLMTDISVTLGGTPGTPYTISLHVQGAVEAKEYAGGVDQQSTSTSPSADGLCVGGSPVKSNAYGVYLLRVTNAGGAQTDYFLNSLVSPGVSDLTTYGVDYTAAIHAQGGAVIRLVAADANCSQSKNCGPTPGDSCSAPLVVPNVAPVVVSSNPTFDFLTPYDGQWLSLAVTKVTSP